MERKKEKTSQQGSFRINREGVQEWTQELNAYPKPCVCDSESRVYVRKLHKVVMVKVFFGERGGGGLGLRCTDRYAEAGREG